MNARDKDKIKVLISEARVWADTNKEHLSSEEVKRLLDNLKENMLRDDDPNEDADKPRICPVCGSRKVGPIVKPGSWGYYPASAHIECKECGTRSREFDGKDDCDDEGAIKKATRAWNNGRVL